MKIVSWNVNGIRGLNKKLGKQSIFDWINTPDVDILCIQETKISKLDDLEDNIQHIPGYESFWNICIEKAGYSGVVTYARKGITINAINNFNNPKFDNEGRVVMTDHTEFVLFNIYFPNIRRGERFEYQLEFFEWIESIVQKYKDDNRAVILAGDFNMISSNLDTTDFEGRWNKDAVSWIQRISSSNEVDGKTFVDAFRFIYPQTRKYTWWDVRLNMRELNIGERIDLFFVDRSLIAHLEDCDSLIKIQGSDHCPIILILKLEVPIVDIIPSLSSEKRKISQPKIFHFFKPQGSEIPIKRAIECVDIIESNKKAKRKD